MEFVNLRESYINTKGFCKVLLLYKLLQNENKLLIVEADIVSETFEIVTECHS
jgi:hypothetical protein